MNEFTEMVFIYLLVLHWLGDFCLESTWVHYNKTKDSEALMWHCIGYFTTLFIGLLICRKFNFFNILIFCGFNFILHYIMDAMTSAVNKITLPLNYTRVFFVWFGFDQLFHVFFLFFLAKLLTWKI